MIIIIQQDVQFAVDYLMNLLSRRNHTKMIGEGGATINIINTLFGDFSGFLTSVLQHHARTSNTSIDSLTYKHVVTDRTWTNADCQSDAELQPINISYQQVTEKSYEAGFIFTLNLLLVRRSSPYNLSRKCINQVTEA